MLQILKLFFWIIILCLCSQSYGSFQIVEVFPNTLDDKNLEYITIQNTSENTQSLSGYILSDASHKQYIFSDEILDIGEERQFFRPETKIILNNSDEEIFLISPEWEEIDSVTYTKTIKWEILEFEPKNNVIEIWEIFISDEVFISWEVFISDETKIELLSSDTASILWDKQQDEIQWNSDIIVPDILIWLQRPSYVSQSWSTDMYRCDRKECKINFDLRNSFSQQYTESSYICRIDFWFWEITWQEEKCNPNTVIFPEWTHRVVFSVYHTEDLNYFSQKEILIYNTPKEWSWDIQSQSIKNTSSVDSKSSWILKERLSLLAPKLIVQSWLVWEGFYYTCQKDVCKINLKYEPRHQDERCYWDFWEGIYSHNMTQYKCNPSFVTLPEWTHKLSLKVYDRNYEDNYTIFPFTVHPKSENLSWERKWEWVSLGEKVLWDSIWEEDSTSEDITLSVELQGKLSKDKTLSWSVLTCSGVEKCSVNLLWIVQWDSKELKYIWKLNGKTFSEKLNPKWIWIEWEWTHKIIFQAWNRQAIFIVEINNSLSSPEKESIKNSSTSWNDSKVKFTQNFLALKYDGLRISGSAPIWSRVEIYHQWKKILSWNTDEKWKYRFVSKSFSVWEYVFDTKIFLNSWEEIYIEASWEFLLVSEKRAYWFVPKKVSPKSSSSSNNVKIPPMLILKNTTEYTPNTSHSLPLKQKIVFIIILLFLWIWMILHMILQNYKRVSAEMYFIYLQQFSVKHKITLILP